MIPIQIQLDSEVRIANLDLIYLSLWRYARELCRMNLIQDALHPSRWN